MIPLIIPIVSLRLGQEDVGTTPTTTTERKAFDFMSAGFGPGYNGPLLVAADARPRPRRRARSTPRSTTRRWRCKTDLEAKQKTLTAQAPR